MAKKTTQVKKTNKKSKSKAAKTSKVEKASKKTEKEEKAAKEVKKSKKPSKAAEVKTTKAAEAEAPAVHTKTRTDKSKLPSILMSKAFLELNNFIDKEEKKLNISRTDMRVGGHLTDAISTGILTLDLVNGGGYQPGRLIVHPGVEMAGKCVTKNTKILTSNGLVPIASLFREDDPWGSPIYRSVKVMTSKGPRTATELHRRKADGLLRIRSEFTLPLECTSEHPVLVVNKTTGKLEYRRADKIVQGDTLLVKTGTSEKFGSSGTLLGKFHGIKIKANNALARIVGVLLADGHIERDTIIVSKRQNLVILENLERDIDDVFGSGFCKYNKYVRKDAHGKPYEYHRVTIDRELSKFLTSCVVDYGNARKKKLPSWVPRLDVDGIKAFLKAYFTCDYSAEGMSSKRLAVELAELLLLIGIPSNIRVKAVKTGKGYHDYYTLTFGAFASDFTALAHFKGMVGKARTKISARRSVKSPNERVSARGKEVAADPYRWRSFPWAFGIIEEFKRPMKGHNSGMYMVEGKYQRLCMKFDKNVTVSQFDNNPEHMRSLELLLPDLADSIKFIRDNNLICVKVTDIEKIEGKQPVYDLTVPGAHNFIANGYVVHNSTGIVTSLANAFSNDIPAFLADTENTFDPKYADKAMNRFNMSIDNMFGVYNKKKCCWDVPPMLRIIQENNGEAVFHLMQRAMKSMPIINRDQDGAWWAVTRLLNKDGSIKSESAVEHDGKPQMFFYIDSFAAMIPDILDSDDEKQTIGAQALMFTRMLPKTCKLLKERNCILVGTNQLRAKIGGFTRVGMPPPMDMPGGNALKFNTSVRTFFAPIAPTTAGWGKSDKEYVEEESISGGVDRYKFISFRNKKHKSFTPLRSGFARIRYMHDGVGGDGFDESYDVFEFLHSTGQATKRGSTISLDIAPVKAKGKDPVLPVDPHAKKISWTDFKRAVEAPENKHKMFNFCREQIKSGHVFEVEQQRITNRNATPSGDSEDDE